MTPSITEHEPPRKSSFRGTAGPLRPVGTITVEPLDDGSRSRVTIEFDLVGHGMGVMMAPFARQQANKQIPQTQEQLKARRRVAEPGAVLRMDYRLHRANLGMFGK